MPESPKKRVKIPFPPSKITSPIPWEIEGISIGRVTYTENTSVYFILLRTTQSAKNQARDIEIKVAVDADRTELKRDSRKRGRLSTEEMVEPEICESI